MACRGSRPDFTRWARVTERGFLSLAVPRRKMRSTDLQMRKTRYEIYRAKSQECKAAAAQFSNPVEKARWLKLSDQWAKMAEKAKSAPKKRAWVSRVRNKTTATLLHT